MKTLAAMGLALALSCGSLASIALAEETETVEAEEDLQLAAPENFTYDAASGEYSFTAVDDRVAYYFVRVYALDDAGKETGEYVASSKRINGKKTGEVSGTVDLSGISWGSYHVNLTTFVPAGTDYIKPEPQSITAVYGVDGKLERPEAMVQVSGKRAEVIIDWYSLTDYAIYEYLPYAQITIYSDEECTEEVVSELIDLADLPAAAEYLPPARAYAWGVKFTGGEHVYHMEYTDMSGNPGELDFAFQNDVYTYELDPGTYYVTVQAIARDEYVQDSEVSEVLSFTLTDEESSSEFETVKTSLWADPVYGMERVYAGAAQQPERVDAVDPEATVSGIVLEE